MSLSLTTSGGGVVVIFRLDRNRTLGGSLRSGLAGVVPRSVMDMRRGTETSSWQLKEDGKEKE